MLPFFSLSAKLLALACIVITIINAIRKNKNPHLKLRWILIPLIFSFISSITNWYISGEISTQNKKDMKALKDTLSLTRNSLDSSLIQQDSLKKKNIELKGELNRIDIRTRQRTISKKNILLIKEELKKRKGEKISIYSLTEDSETEVLAHELKSLFDECGWDVVHYGAYGGFLEPQIGIKVNYEDTKYKDKVSFILRILDMAELNPEIGSVLPQQLKQKEVEILVGLKPR
jgi:predicted transcriptional regulator